MSRLYFHEPAMKARLSSSHLLSQYSQRFANLQPGFTLIGLLTSPRISCISFPLASREGSGIAASSALVYGCSGFSNNSSELAYSTLFPRYITMILLEMCFTTLRSWVTNIYVRPSDSCRSISRLRICA